MSNVTAASNTNFRSYVDQCLHYLMRPHEVVPVGPVESPAAWRGSDVRNRTDWSFSFTEGDIREIEAAIEYGRSTGLPLAKWSVDDFPLPGLRGRITHWRHEIEHGLGFVLLTGLPVERWGVEKSECFFWAFGLHLGIPGAQNPQGDLLGHITDKGNQAKDAVIRLYQTSENLSYHCDAADVVGLLCLQPAMLGGASRIASSVTIWNELWARKPKLAQRLFEPVYVDLREELSPEGNPWNLVTPCRYANNTLRTFYHGDYFRSAARHKSLPIGEAELQLFELYDAIANEPDICLDMNLKAGDIQLISNHTIVHARTAFEDSATHKRHLLRLWLSL